MSENATRSDDIAHLTRGLAGPWRIAKVERGLEFTCQAGGCSHHAVIEMDAHTANRLNRLAHECGVKNITAETSDSGYAVPKAWKRGTENATPGGRGPKVYVQGDDE